MIVNIKNGSAQLLARRVYITSNIGWENWWGSELLANKNDKGAIERRITENRKFDVIYMPDLPNTTNNNNTPVTWVGDEYDHNYTLRRSDAMLVGQNTLDELYCDEEAECFPTSDNHHHSLCNMATQRKRGI